MEVPHVSNVNTKRVVVNIPQTLLEQVDGIASRTQTNRSEIIREAMRRYVTEHWKADIRTAMQQGYLEMARINLRIASEAFPLEQEAGGTVERLVSGV
ncbi:MAG: ribbon-helix-helix protein, CopG family [Alicyclobacillus sp.]|nr:ribbon-helix-helix protein, CopG family [Alicyclobacillus sp.]